MQISDPSMSLRTAFSQLAWQKSPSIVCFPMLRVIPLRSSARRVSTLARIGARKSAPEDGSSGRPGSGPRPHSLPTICNAAATWLFSHFSKARIRRLGVVSLTPLGNPDWELKKMAVATTHCSAQAPPYSRKSKTGSEIVYCLSRQRPPLASSLSHCRTALRVTFPCCTQLLHTMSMSSGMQESGTPPWNRSGVTYASFFAGSQSAKE